MSRFRYTLQPDHVLDRDPFYYEVAPYQPLPPVVDLTEWMGPTRNQGQIGDCSGMATAGFREWWARRFPDPRLPEQPLSALFIYSEERLREHTLNQDSGARLRDAAWVLTNLGVCPETDWPSTPDRLYTAPSEAAVTAAAPWRLPYAYRLGGLADCLHCLAAGYPAVIGIGITPEWETDAVLESGIVPVPNPGAPLLGGHAILLLGYHLADQWVVIQNSWGNVGINGSGLFRVPFTYLNHYLWSAWTFRAAEAGPPTISEDGARKATKAKGAKSA